MDKSIMLDINTILNKDFSIDFKGYSPIEVNQFLDMVIKDYDTYQHIISELNEKISYYEENTDNLKTKIIELENKLKNAEENAANSTQNPTVNNLSQVDILRRIARLEQEVFNRK